MNNFSGLFNSAIAGIIYFIYGVITFISASRKATSSSYIDDDYDPSSHFGLGNTIVTSWWLLILFIYTFTTSCMKFDNMIGSLGKIAFKVAFIFIVVSLIQQLALSFSYGRLINIKKTKESFDIFVSANSILFICVIIFCGLMGYTFFTKPEDKLPVIDTQTTYAMYLVALLSVTSSILYFIVHGQYANMPDP